MAEKRIVEKARRPWCLTALPSQAYSISLKACRAVCRPDAMCFPDPHVIIYEEPANMTAANLTYSFLLDTYETEILKIVGIWRAFPESAMSYKPHPKSRSVI